LQSRSRYRPLKIGDFLIIIIFLSSLFFIPRSAGEKVIVIVDKRKEYIYPLNVDRIVEFRAKIGIMKLEIKNKKARVIESKCPLKICMKKGWIKSKGEQIICVPNQVIIRIDGEQLDAVTE
jgi:hypothetical protein